MKNECTVNVTFQKILESVEEIDWMLGILKHNRNEIEQDNSCSTNKEIDSTIEKLVNQKEEFFDYVYNSHEKTTKCYQGENESSGYTKEIDKLIKISQEEQEKYKENNPEKLVAMKHSLSLLEIKRIILKLRGQLAKSQIENSEQINIESPLPRFIFNLQKEYNKSNRVIDFFEWKANGHAEDYYWITITEKRKSNEHNVTSIPLTGTELSELYQNIEEELEIKGLIKRSWRPMN